MCTIYTWTCAVLTGVFAVPPAAALTAVPALDADLETGLEVLITWASLSRLNLSSSIWRTFRCSSSRVCGWWWWWLSTSESSPSPELERLALENKKHIQNTAWESNKNLAGIIYSKLLGTSCYPRSSTETWGYRSGTPLILKLRLYLPRCHLLCFT